MLRRPLSCVLFLILLVGSPACTTTAGHDRGTLSRLSVAVESCGKDGSSAGGKPSLEDISAEDKKSGAEDELLPGLMDRVKSLLVKLKISF